MITTSTDKAVFKAFAKPEDKAAFGHAVPVLSGNETKPAFLRLHSLSEVSKSAEIPLGGTVSSAAGGEQGNDGSVLGHRTFDRGAAIDFFELGQKHGEP